MVNKYIDAELLRKEIEKNKNIIDMLFTEGDDSVYDGENDAYNRVFRIIDSLQQEQLKVDLEEEIATWIPSHITGGEEGVWKECREAVTKWAGIVAHHFYELGLEYISKDALLEKLEKVAAEYKKRSDEGELVWQNMCGINETIDILNKM